MSITVTLKPHEQVKYVEPIFEFGQAIESVNKCNMVFADANAMWHFNAMELAAILKGLASPIPTNMINIKEM